MATATKTKAKNVTANKEPGIIGQMYQDKKTDKIGVLESREKDFKTLMMRAVDGTTFNLNYSTFRNGWKKYQGDEVVETSTQVEEKKAEQKKADKAEKSVEKAITKTSEKIKFSTEDKVKAVRALEEFVEKRIAANKSDLRVSRNSRGGVIVGLNRYTVFEVWVKYGIDRYDIFFRDAIADTLNKTEFKALASTPNTEYKEHETWSLRHGYRVPNTELGNFLDKLIVICDKYVKENRAKKEKVEKKEKN